MIKRQSAFLVMNPIMVLAMVSSLLLRTKGNCLMLGYGSTCMGFSVDALDKFGNLH